MNVNGKIKETFSTGFSFDCITYETLKVGLRGRQYKVEITFCIDGYSDIDLGQINHFSKDVWKPMFHHSVFVGPHIDYEASGCGKSFYCMDNNKILKRPKGMILGGDFYQAIPNK
jgi:hypothetical protein